MSYCAYKPVEPSASIVLLPHSCVPGQLLLIDTRLYQESPLRSLLWSYSPASPGRAVVLFYVPVGPLSSTVVLNFAFLVSFLSEMVGPLKAGTVFLLFLYALELGMLLAT